MSIMDISKMAIESDIQISPPIYTNYDLKSSIHLLQVFRKKEVKALPPNLSGILASLFCRFG
jgi:hypothetical protein